MGSTPLNVHWGQNFSKPTILPCIILSYTVFAVLLANMTKEENFPTKPETTSTSSMNTTSRLANTRTTEFFPSYLPNSFTEINASSNGSDPPPYSPTDPCHSLPPSYSADEPSSSNENASSVKNLPSCPPPYPLDGSTAEVKKIPPYPIDPSSGGLFPIPHPPNSSDAQAVNGPSILNLISKNSPKSSKNNNAPSAPSVGEIDYRTGLTASEREGITEALSKMESNVYWRTAVGETAFSDAEKNVLELLLAAESRLTEIEKQELAVKVRNINKLRRNWIKGEMGKLIKKRQDRKKEETKKKDAIGGSIAFKVAELVLDIIILLPSSSPQTRPFEIISFLFSSSAIVVCVAFMLAYCWYDKISKAGYALDAVLCFVFAFAYLIFGILNESSLAVTTAFIVAILYSLDLCYKIHLSGNENFFKNSSDSDSVNSISNRRRSGTSRRNSYTPSYYYSVNHNGVRETNHYTTNNCLVEDLPAGVDFALNLNRMNVTSHLLDFLNVNPNDRDSDGHEDFEGGFRSYNHNGGDSGGGNYESRCHDSVNNRYDDNYTTEGDCSASDANYGEGGDFGGDNDGSCDFGGSDCDD